MRKPVIGIIGRPDSASDDDKVICIWEYSRIAIFKMGGIPILILPPQSFEYELVRPKDAPRLKNDEIEDLKQIVDMCDGILIPGGYKTYEYDYVIYEYALKKDIPILGICAGMQLMARVDNANDILRNTIVKNETTLNHHQRGKKHVHNVNIVEGTILKKIVNKDSFLVNSQHNYHVSKTCNMTVSAYSEDGLIEAIEYPGKKFVMGIQWHPEKLIDSDEFAKKLINYFITIIKK